MTTAAAPDTPVIRFAALADRWPGLWGTWRCAAAAPLGGLLGATLDQWHHAGFAIWLTLCQSGTPGPVDVLALQVRLMPAMLAFMLGAMAWQWAGPARRAHRPLVLALCQAGCVLGMTVAAGGCAAIAGIPAGTGVRLLAMGLMDLGASVAGATLLVLPLVARGDRLPPGASPHCDCAG